MHGLDTLIQAAHLVQEVFSDWPEEGRQPVFAKGDHEQAYRNWPCILMSRYTLPRSSGMAP